MRANYIKEVEPTLLLQCFIELEEIVNVVAFVASEVLGCINGSSVRAEGGILHSIV
jgi:hypothetical protein